MTDYVDGIEAYGANLDSEVESQMSIVEVLDVVLGTGYARNLTATEHVRNEYGADLSDADAAEFEAIDHLVEAVAIARQFFKTISPQRDFARFSRLGAYTGLVALFTSLVMALVYRTNSVTVSPEHLPIVVSLGVAVIAVPLAVFPSYVLRAATIAHRTVSIGPFVPPGDRPEDS